MPLIKTDHQSQISRYLYNIKHFTNFINKFWFRQAHEPPIAHPALLICLPPGTVQETGKIMRAAAGGEVAIIFPHQAARRRQRAIDCPANLREISGGATIHPDEPNGSPVIRVPIQKHPNSLPLQG
jgi:hypothetical protein